MPIKYEGKHTCEKCENIFDWAYFAPEKQEYGKSIYTVEEVPNITLAYLFSKNAQSGYDVGVNCPFCDYDNRFVESEMEIKANEN